MRVEWVEWMAAVLGVTVAATPFGCSSSSTASGGNGADAAAGGDAGAEGGGACLLPPGTDPYCLALACPGAGCDKSAACQEARLAVCPDSRAASSDALQAAIVACQATTACNDLGASTACLFERVDAAPRTSAEQQLAAHYCATCAADAGATCAASFYDRSSPAGLTLLLYSDAVIAEIDTTCATTSGCATFTTCAAGVGDRHTPPLPASCN